MNSNAPAVNPAIPALYRVARITGRTKTLVRASWLAVAFLYLSLFLASLPPYYRQAVAFEVPQPEVADPATLQTSFDMLGLSPSVWATITVFELVVFVLGFVAAGAFIVWRKPDERIAWIFAVIIVAFGATFPNTLQALPEPPPLLRVPLTLIDVLGFAALFPLFYVFPDGRFTPTWTRWTAALWIGAFLGANLLPGTLADAGSWPFAGGELLQLAVLGTALWAPIYRFRHASSLVERQQLKWFAVGVVVAIVGMVGVGVLPRLFPSLHEPGVPAALFAFAVPTIYVTSFLMIPVAALFAMLRYRLWDIDPIVNRALVYALLTASVIGLYVVIIGWLGVVFRAHNSLLLSLVATGVVAVAFEPLRLVLQRGVNRAMYGERDEPYAVVSRLSRRLEGALAPEAILPAVATTVAEALKLPYVAVVLPHGELAASVGEPVPDPLRLPLVYQHEVAGDLLVAPRAPGEEFSASDQRLLLDLARQVGVAAHAVRLNADLRQARERLVVAREEERRRLRGDLHDGVGSLLVGVNMQLGGLRRLVAGNDAADAELVEIRDTLHHAVEMVRSISRDLRPPALDELGLPAAVQALVRQYSGQDCSIVLEVPDDLPRLSAAVEVAIYRIVQEALANVVRHAGAGCCVVSIHVEHGLQLAIADDGHGIPAGRSGGVGLLSMRERAEELGGSFAVEPNPGGGTRIIARFPLAGGPAVSS